MFFLIVLCAVVLILILLMRKKKTSEEVAASGRDKILLTLPKPENLKAVNDNGTVTFTWSESATSASRAKSFNLYFSNKSGFKIEEARQISKITGDEFVVTGVPAGIYYYRMSSVFGGRESGLTDEHQVAVNICILSEPPSNFMYRIKTLGPNTTQILFSWDSQLTYDGYQIRLHKGPPFHGHGDVNDEDMIIDIQDPKTRHYEVSNLDMNFEWSATIASVVQHCGPGARSDPIKLK